MTEPVPDPAAHEGLSTEHLESTFNFQDLNVEPATLPGNEDFTPPNYKASKPRWWERRKSAESRNASRPRKAPKPVPKMPMGGLITPLENLYTSVGMSILPFDPTCGKAVIEAAPKCAEALNELAKTNPAVRRILISLVTTSAIGAVIMAHAPIIMALAMHHVPALRDRQEKMVAQFAEMMANGFQPGPAPTEETE